MHHYCVIVAKTRDAASQLATRLEQFVHTRLSFEPDELVVHRIGPRTFAFGASAEQRPLGIDTPAHITDDETCFVGGLPTFERFPRYEPSGRMRPAAWASELLQEHDPSDLYSALGGTWSIISAKAESVVGFASFAGYDSLFYIDNDLYAAVGNRPSLIAALQSGGAHSAINRRALSWVFATTMILGDETPWCEVTRLRTDEVVTIHRARMAIATIGSQSFTPPEANHPAAFYDSAVRGLVSRFEWYLRTGRKFKAHLTGGKDSRMIIALLLATGAIDRVDAIITWGSEQNGDVIIARRIAAALGLRNHVVHEGHKQAVDTVDWRQHERRFRFSPWKYDMYLTPYDGRGVVAGAPASDLTFMGGGGEIIRQKGIAPDSEVDEIDGIATRFTNWYYRHDALELLHPDTAAWQRTMIRDEVEAMVEAGVVNLQQRFYIEHRMANWGSAHFRGASSSAVAALLDLDLARAMHARADMADDIPYEILTRCAPELRAFPFVNDEWLGQTRERAQADGTFSPPVTVAAAKSFPWQFALYRDHRDHLLHECLRSISVWDGMVSPERARQLRDRPVEPFNSAHIKMLFGLLAGTNYMLGMLAPAREFWATTTPLRLVGNRSGEAHGWFEHRQHSAGAAGDSDALSPTNGSG